MFRAVRRKSSNLSEQMENTYLSRPRGLAGWILPFFGVFGRLRRGKRAAGCEIFRKSILRPFQASGGKIRRANGFRVLKSIFWCNLGAF
jgi:hypothetical protein